jgi:hypothetical protein
MIDADKPMGDKQTDTIKSMTRGTTAYLFARRGVSPLSDTLLLQG